MMKKILLFPFVALIIVACGEEKKEYCECVDLTLELLEKVMSGEMTESDADKEMAGCAWIEDLSDEENAKKILECDGAIDEVLDNVDEYEDLLEDEGL